MEELKIKRKYISKWKIEVEEISRNCWEGIATRNSGNVVACHGLDPDEIMKKLEMDFWTIELQLTTDISYLLFNYINERAAYEGQKLSLLEQPEHFGSWIIYNDGRQIIYDGKEQWFVMRLKVNELNFIDEPIIKLKEITPEKIARLYSWLIGYTP